MDKSEIRKMLLEDLLESSINRKEEAIVGFAKIMLEIQPYENIKEYKKILSEKYDVDEYYIELFIDFLNNLDRKVDRIYKSLSEQTSGV